MTKTLQKWGARKFRGPREKEPSFLFDTIIDMVHLSLLLRLQFSIRETLTVPTESALHFRIKTAVARGVQTDTAHKATGART